MNASRYFYKDFLTQNKLSKKVKFYLDLIFTKGNKFQNDVVRIWEEGRSKELKFDLIMKKRDIDGARTLYMFNNPKLNTKIDGDYWCGFVSGQKRERYYTATEVMKGTLTLSEWGKGYHGNMGIEINDPECMMDKLAEACRECDMDKILDELDERIRVLRKEKQKKRFGAVRRKLIERGIIKND